MPKPQSNDWQKHWDRFGTEKIAAEIDVPAPPCSGCRFWAPRRTYENRIFGLRFCHAETMYYDFSCFDPYPPADSANKVEPRHGD